MNTKHGGLGVFEGPELVDLRSPVALVYLHENTFKKKHRQSCDRCKQNIQNITTSSAQCFRCVFQHEESATFQVLLIVAAREFLSCVGSPCAQRSIIRWRKLAKLWPEAMRNNTLCSRWRLTRFSSRRIWGVKGTRRN